MLSAAPIRAYIPVSNVPRARKFYEGKIGLKPKEEYAGGVIYECGGAEVFMYPTPNAGTSKASQAYWQVDDVEAEVAELKARGVRATGAPVDVTDGAALKAWIASVAQELGSIDMLFSNAGAMAQGGDPASWEQNFRLDVLGAVNAFEAARPFLEASGEKSGDAAFVLISSVAAAQAMISNLPVVPSRRRAATQDVATK